MKNWHQVFSDNIVQMTPTNAVKEGWYEVCVEPKDANSFPLLMTLTLHFSDSKQNLPFCIKKHGLQTFFYYKKSINHISLDFLKNQIDISGFTIALTKKWTVSALYQMMNFISQRDKNNSNDSTRIYDKSYARFKRHGYTGFLSRLLKEYYRADTYLLPEEDIYSLWIANNEFHCEESFSKRVALLQLTPKISIIMATWRSNLIFLKAAIDSVRSQLYANWELCISDDASGDAQLKDFLLSLTLEDSRIKVIFREERGHISAAQNTALTLADGDYVAFLDHDDLLSQDALLCVVEAINLNPSVKLLYSDEDKINQLGQRVTPHFKSKWNPDLLLSQNYITHLLVVETKLIKAVGGFHLGVEGSQDHDLLLRLAAKLDAKHIYHIPKILYHWRIIEGSTALSADAKNYTEVAGINALAKYFEQLGLSVKVGSGLLPNTYRIHYPIPSPNPLVSLIIPTRDKVDLLKPCIESILSKTTYNNYEIIIIDNGSIDPNTLAYFSFLKRNYPNITIIEYHYPFNYSAINNYAVSLAKGSIIGLINNDIEVISAGWLTEMVGHACRSEVGCVGAKLYFSDGAIQHAGVILGIGGVAGHAHKYFDQHAHGYFSRLKLVQNLSAVTGACLIVRKDVYQLVNGLNEENLKVAFNDVDFCLKVREAGYLNVWTPFAELYHHESKSRGAEDTPEKQARFQQEVLWMQSRWGNVLQQDPYYSTNLTKEHEDFSLRIRSKE